MKEEKNKFKPDLPQVLKEYFGKNALFDVKGKFCLVHLDNPDEKIRKLRVNMFDPDVFFEADCPICSKFKHEGCYIVFSGDLPYAVRFVDKNWFEVTGPSCIWIEQYLGKKVPKPKC